MRKHIALLLLLTLLCAPALAVTQGGSAIPNQKLYFRTGPNTVFTELYAMPMNTDVIAIEMEEGNDVTWVLCDFEYKGNRVRGYTGLKRLDLCDPILWASNYSLPRTLVSDGDVYAAPDDTADKRAALKAGTAVTFLNFEGSFCYIEYKKGKQRERGYIHESAFWVDQYEFAEWFPDNEYMSWYVVRTPAYVYETFAGSEQPVYSIPYDCSVIVNFSDDLPGDWISVYYAGQWKFGHRGDFNDLRGYVEPGY